MSQDNFAHTRDWQEIAREASVEMDPKKLQRLAEELERALDERDGKQRADS